MRALEPVKMGRKWLTHRVVTARPPPSFGGRVDREFLKEGIVLALQLKHTPGISQKERPWQPKGHKFKSKEAFKPKCNFQIRALTHCK